MAVSYFNLSEPLTTNLNNYTSIDGVNDISSDNEFEQVSSSCNDCRIQEQPIDEDRCVEFIMKVPEVECLANKIPSTLLPTESKQVTPALQRFFSCRSETEGLPEGEPISDEHDLVDYPSQMKTYRMHLATVPGNEAEKFEVNKSLTVHCELIRNVKQFLDSLYVTYQMLDEKSFSSTETWGVEPYACLLVTCTRTMVRGLCALFGLAFRQAAVGIFTCFTTDADQPHNIFLISRSDYSAITVEEALEIFKSVRTSCPALSGQRDTTGASVELHDYCNEEPSMTNIRLTELLPNQPHSHPSYQVKQGAAKSFLVDEKDYTEAIQKAGLESYEFLIKMCQVHSKMYPEY